MKNKVLLALLIIAPALCACHGFTISAEEALAVLSNIEASIKDSVPFENFIEVYKTKKGSNEIEERKFFNKEQKFLHQFRIIVNSDLSESYTYVKNNYIYDVRRNTTGAIDPGDAPTYTITSKVAYTDAAWSEREKAFISDIMSFYSSAIDNCKKFVNNSDVDARFSSNGAKSLYVTAKQKVEAVESKEITFTYEFYNSQLKMQNRQDGEDNESYDWSYGEVKVSYPDVQEPEQK